jgi:secreted trypsin-like serine protease
VGVHRDVDRPDTVVTAGHCASFATRVFFGGDVTKSGRIVRVRERVRHPDYRKNGKQNDLLVLLLDERVENVTARKIATTKTIDAATDGRVVGFGNTDPMGSTGYGVKRQVDVPIASAACRGTLDGEADSAAYGCDKGLELVAGKPLLMKDSCTGDSGGPFYIGSPNGDWLLAGATSRATNSAPNDCGDGGIYVRVDKYRKWIDGIPRAPRRG